MKSKLNSLLRLMSINSKKTIVTTTVVIGYFLMMSTLGIIAAVPGNVEKAAKENVRREIIKSIPCPEFISENNEANEVKAIVSVDESGNVSVFEINSANPQLKEYVVDALKDMKLNHTTASDKFVLIIKFRIG